MPIYLSVQAVDLAGNRGALAFSTAARVDLSPPGPPQALAPPPSPNRNSTLTWKWNDAFDSGSGVAEYQVQVGSSFATGDFVAWTSVFAPSFSLDTATSGGRYFFSVRAVDGLGWISASVSSIDGVLVDLVPPTRVVLSTDKTVTNATEATATWTVASDEGGSALARYEVELQSASTVARTDTDTLSHSVAFTGEDGTTYTIRVRAWDGAGNAGEWSQDRTVLFDRTPPSGPAEVRSEVVGKRVTFSWQPAGDSASGVAGYRVRVGSAPGGDDVVGERLTNETSVTFEGEAGRTYYLTLTSVDRAGNADPYGGGGTAVSVPQATRTPGLEAGPLVLALAGVASIQRRRTRP
jgi:hypothetical protein